MRSVAAVLIFSIALATPVGAQTDEITDISARAEAQAVEAGRVLEAYMYVVGVYAYLAAQAEAAIVNRWTGVHNCEQPDSWTVAGRFGNGMSGGGGLGISNAAWRENGGGQYAPIPGQATPREQMEIAERILARHGRGAWECPVP